MQANKKLMLILESKAAVALEINKDINPPAKYEDTCPTLQKFPITTMPNSGLGIP